MSAVPTTSDQRADAARRAVSENPTWYHTIDLAPGITTPGHVDLRATAARLLPDDLSGKRALDIGTFDGFWAFEMERRGAEVVAIDTERVEDNEWPPISRRRLEEQSKHWDVVLGRGFRLAADALGSGVERITCGIHELTPAIVGGQVDFVFSGSILVHLRDPVGALERIHEALADDGELRIMEPLSLGLTALFPRRPVARFRTLETDFNWWQANLATLRAWCQTAGFAEVRRCGFVRPEAISRMRQLYVGLACRP